MTSEKPQVEDVDNVLEQIKFDLDKAAINIKSSHQRSQKDIEILERNYIQAFERGLWGESLTELGVVLRNEFRKRGLTENQIRKAVGKLQPEHKRKYPTGDALECISDPEFEQMQESVFDQTEEMSQRVLSDKQLDKLSDAEGIEVVSNEISWRKSRKTIDNDRIKHLIEYAMKRGWKLVDKVTKELPPKNFRGQGEMYFALEELVRQHDILSDMFRDLETQVYNFKPDKEHEQKALGELEQWVNNTFIPITKVSTEIAEGTKTIMRNITDEKYSNSNSAWMKQAEEKFLAYGNHGSGEVNAVVSNKVILKLGKDVVDEFGDVHKAIPTIIKVPVKRETTREQVGDKTIFEMQGTFDCPNCNTSFPISDEQRDLIAGDLFHQAKTTLLCNGLSNAIDTLADNIVYEHVKDPIVWLREKYNKKYTDEQIRKALVKEGQPEKIKDSDIDPSDITEKRHGMYRNAATRRLEKAQHFSDNS